jgi:GDPmannose 4,6-dehydratase
MRALITGITGQDGSYLSELLLLKGYEVHGFVRPMALEDPLHRMWRIRHLLDRLILHTVSMDSYPSIFSVIERVHPDECYHLAAQSFVSYSFEDAFSTISTNINGTHFLLSSIKRKAPKCRFYFAASSEIFGKASVTPQNENTPFHPRSPYGISKLAGFELTRNYREAYQLHASSGILFNHESPRRGHQFVTRKITSHAALIKLGHESKIKLGNLDALRDWGHSREYVQAMWLMLQQKKADDYVIATGTNYSVGDFLDKAFSSLELDYRDYIEIDQALYRPAEAVPLQGDYTKDKKVLGWNPRIFLPELVLEMVKSDLSLFSQGQYGSGGRYVAP